MTPAILAVGHGTRNEIGQRQFAAVVDALAAVEPAGSVSRAFVEIQAPSVAEALVRLAEAGCRQVVLAPLLLFAGGHAKTDLPREIAAAKARCPELLVSQADALGCAQPLLQLAAARRQAALLNREHLSDSLLLVVGRGGSDSAAIADCREFARRLAEVTRDSAHSTAFIAVAQPLLPAALAEICQQAKPPARVIVQPHLLFQGEMQLSVEAAVARARAESPSLEWIVCRPLGHGLEAPSAEHDAATARATGLLVDALRERIRSAAAPR